MSEHITAQGILVTNRVFVGGIPSWMNEIKLQLEFEERNLEVKDTRIVEDMKTGKPKGYGFVTFFEARVAEELIKEGHIKTKDGLRFRISQAIRRKALELRQKQQIMQHQNFCASYQPNQVQYRHLPIQPTKSQVQAPNVYPGRAQYYILNTAYPEQYYPNSTQQILRPNNSILLFYHVI